MRVDSLIEATKFDGSNRLDKGAHIDIGLFGGAGGLTLGLSAAGLSPDHIFEIDTSCCATLRHNSKTNQRYISAEIHKEDVSLVDWSRFTSPVRILSGGPPCQPFSIGGKQLSFDDERDQFPVVLRAIHELTPAVVLLENVPGMMRHSCRDYLAYVIRRLENPSHTVMVGEAWHEHNERLLKFLSSGGHENEYTVSRWVLNAADFGGAQARSRLFLLATRTGIQAVDKPTPTHSRAALFESQKSSDYWRDRELPVRRRLVWPKRVGGAVGGKGREPWVTVRDALRGLPPAPRVDEARDNHWRIEGARVYRGHTGSELDWPAKTIKAGVHGVGGGENVLLLDDGGFRYFTLREIARIQGFPDDYFFVGARSSVIRQIGNAVPLRLGQVIGEKIVSSLTGRSLDKSGALMSGSVARTVGGSRRTAGPRGLVLERLSSDRSEVDRLMSTEVVLRTRRRLLRWGRVHYRPYSWRAEEDEWLTFVAEFLLQRTQARQVDKVFPQIKEAFRTPSVLVAAARNESATITKGLGLHRRTDLLMDIAREVEIRGGKLPKDLNRLCRFKGVGLYTAAAWLSLHQGVRAPLIDANVCRWLSRMTGMPYNRDPRHVRWVQYLADELTPKRVFRDYNFAVLDFTIAVCSTPTPFCAACPLKPDCVYGRATSKPK